MSDFQKSNIDNLKPEFEKIKLSGQNLAQNYVSAFNTGMNIYQCINYLQGNIALLFNNVNSIVDIWNENLNNAIEYTINYVKEQTPNIVNEQVNDLVRQLTEQYGSDITQLKADVSSLKTDVSSLKTDMSKLNTDVSSLKTDNTKNKSDITNLKETVSTNTSDILTIKNSQLAMLNGTTSVLAEQGGELNAISKK